MTCKSLFQASFEESLNLQDDSISGEFSRKAVTEFERVEAKRGKIKSQLIYLIYTLLFVFGLNYLLVIIANYAMYNESANPLFKTPLLNFLPKSVFYITALLWLMLIFWGKIRSQLFMRGYRLSFHTNTALVWFVIETNLLFLTILSPILGSFLVLLFYSSVIVICYLIYYSRVKSLRTLLYGVEEVLVKKSNLFERILTIFFKYGWGFVVVYFIFKLIFPNSVASHQDWLGFLGLMSIWFFMNIVIFIVQMYLFFPYFLQGYYKLKYPKDYREWEGKTVEEWYGKQYLSKKGIADDL